MNLNEIENEIVKDMASFQQDPYKWVLYSFDWDGPMLREHKIEDWQASLLKSIGSKLRENSIQTVEGALQYTGEAIKEARSSGHGVGKSALVSWIILWALSTFENTRGIVTANTDTQLKTKTWPELTKWYNLFIAKHWFTLTATSIFSSAQEHEKTWRFDAIPWSINNTEAFAGLHNEGKRTVLIFDESSAIADAIWDVSEGALTDANTEIIWLAFGNPTRNTGRFHDCFNANRHRWGHGTVDARTVSLTNKEQIKQWIEDYGEDSDFVRVRVRGLEPHQSADQFISLDIIRGAFGRQVKEHQFSYAPRIMGVDPKYSGADEFTIVMRQGLMSWILGVYQQGTDDDQRMAGVIARFEDELKVDAVNIDFGYGTGIHSFGRIMNRNWNLIAFGGKSPDPAYLNMRAYMWGTMKQWLKEGGCIPKDDGLMTELASPEGYVKATGGASGKIYLESKEDMKSRGVMSPNKADGLALTFALPIIPKTTFTGLPIKDVILSEYNPLEQEAERPRTRVEVGNVH